jgi:hypothetical protein
MYAPNHEQGVKMRYGLAGQMRRRAYETDDSYYRRLFQNAALDLESAAEALERAAWRPHLRLAH